MNMDGMKRAAKMLMRGGGDLGSVVVDAKSLQGVIGGKLIPSINNVATGLLKWSYTESNYTFPDVFSAWADLDAGFTQLLQEYLEEFSRYRKSFKEILAESKKVSDLQKEKERTANKVTAVSSKLEAARKAAKKNEGNEKAKAHVTNMEADLYVAKAKDEETEELLRNATADFENYKASMLRDSLITHCQCLKDLLQKGTDLCQTKLDIAKSMPDDPATAPDPGAENNRKVEAIFNKYRLQLSPRDPTLERNLPAQRYKTLPPSQTQYPPKSPRITNQLSVPAKPVGGRLSKQAVAIPVVDEEEEYVVPTLSPKSPGGNKQQVPLSPKEVMEADYFQVDNGENFGEPPSSARKTSNTRQPDLVSEPVYTIPPDEEEDDTDANQLYGNMTNEELEEHKRTSVLNTPTKPMPYAKKPKKPAVYPKPVQKPTKTAPLQHRQDSATKDEQATEEDDDIYSMVCDVENTPEKTGVSLSSRVSPPVPAQRHTFLDFEHLDHDRKPDSCKPEIKQSYVHLSSSPRPEHLPQQESYQLGGETNDDEISHTYYHTSMGDKLTPEDDLSLYKNMPVPEQAVPTTTETKHSPSVAKKPPVSPWKPSVPGRGGVK
ncbi:uncharacterized protein LOC110977860 isoform X2 [Acanthaster planci]|uniref:Uncharacterized protein LOC110977860 isoform X2 n=1 Tax=Acanthaster planci TaxID=133434 RepID=A0A8B7Y4E2_ACAPL|nr:uncharacterized protein LOC110977860 isoform X2 [Acanthaster planci]